MSAEEPPSDGDGSEYSPDTIHHILRNRRRRAVLFYLKYHEGGTTMRELTKEIASWEFGVPKDEVTSQQRERIYVSLHQTHLPTLDEQDIIGYDEDRKRIDPGPGMPAFEPFIDPKQTDENIDDLVDESYRTVYAGIEHGDLDETRKNWILKTLTPSISGDERWSTYYLTAAGLGAVFIWLGSPLSPVQIPMGVAAIVQTGMFATLAFIHAFVEADPEEVATAEEMFLGRLRPDWAEE